MVPLFNLHFEHSGSLVAVAIGICLTASWSVAMLAIDLDRTAAEPGEPLGWRHAALALAAGLGVWATHFIAILAYRPDLLLRYDVPITILSALVGIALVGVPLVAVTRLRRRVARIAAATIAGAGIWCMHAVGLTGMTDCVHVFSWPTNITGLVLGTVLMATWQLHRGWARSRTAACMLFALAICTTHFVALSGDIVVGSIGDVRGSLLSPGLVAACMAFGVSVTCLASLLTFERFRTTREEEGHTLRAVLESMSDGLVFIDGNARLQHFNHRFLEMYAIPDGAIAPGMTITACIDIVARHRGWRPERRAEIRAAMQQWIRTDATFDREWAMDDGCVYRMQCRPMQSKGVVLTFNDVSAERQALRNLTHLAYHDPLTGLGNRRSLREQKEARIRIGTPFSLLMIDLDDFKRINDAFGHAVGDQLLVHVAAELTRLLPADSFIARMGGDELAILASETGEAAAALADSIVAQLSGAVVINGCRLLPSCSIGISQFSGACSADDLMKRADMALYEAKRLGRRRAQAYLPGLAERLAERQGIVDDLHEAVQTGGFALAFQPVVDLLTGGTTGYEALIRWNHPVRGWIPPGVFIPIAEQCGLVEDIGRWVMMEACRHLAGWSPHLNVAINISAAQLKSEGLLHSLTQAILIHGVAPERVEIEITETALIDDAGRTAVMLDRIRKLGIKVSLDDFGTGQSSLAHLRDFRFDRIKIDRSFVAEAANDPRCMAVLRATVAIGKELGVLTHAEGVETREQLDVLHDIGCDVAQGYLLGRPVVPFTDATADFAELPGDTIIGAPGDTDPQSSGVTVTRLAA
ncbi:EAL domain-containing protein [Sphingomonas sp. PvP018]|uniref:bifunctional diguanylate cyclase/phosphodiesterase n=2 Tax=Sphingomonas TaxID=13687 RepID=UPI001AE484A9|nr:diguanylate cyclase (GGDEF)-like protein [Sphingomonas sp. PvP018]